MPIAVTFPVAVDGAVGSDLTSELGNSLVANRATKMSGFDDSGYDILTI